MLFMPVTLTPDDINEHYDGLTASAKDIEDAEQAILSTTNYTPSDHVDIRNQPESSVQRAWAIVADRIRARTVEQGSEHFTSEGKGDLNYTRTANYSPYRGLLEGLPMELLGYPRTVSTSTRHDSRAWLGFFDDYGVYFPPAG